MSHRRTIRHPAVDAFGQSPPSRVLFTLTVLLAVYYTFPFEDPVDGWFILWLVVALLVLAVLAAFEVRSILRSPFPQAKAVEAAVTVATLLLALFATAYYVVSEADPASFTEQLTRTDALYFVITVFSTVGFGDISAQSQGARALVSGQIVVNMVLLGLGARIIVGAVKRSRGNTDEAL